MNRALSRTLIRMKILFFFLDGVGLGADDPGTNPLVRASMPDVNTLLEGHKIIANGHNTSTGVGPWLIHTRRASLLALDACLGIEGMPQSASGQASLLTGKNVPGLLGAHVGPKPDPAVMGILNHGTLFSHLSEQKLKTSLANAYPPRYFTSIERGYRIPGVIVLAAKYAGMHINTRDDLAHGEAISADFTAQGWREHLGLVDTPLLNPHQAGERLADLAAGNELTFFEYWLTDVAGHHQDMQNACELLELFSHVLGSLVSAWDDDQGLILITSDHGNLEDLSTRHHTRNDVPLILIGSQILRERFIEVLFQVNRSKTKLDLTDITPAILGLI